MIQCEKGGYDDEIKRHLTNRWLKKDNYNFSHFVL